jgi:hypothetical protein
MLIKIVLIPPAWLRLGRMNNVQNNYGMKIMLPFFLGSANLIPHRVAFPLSKGT